jgi:hypothetical protein
MFDKFVSGESGHLRSWLVTCSILVGLPCISFAMAIPNSPVVTPAPCAAVAARAPDTRTAAAPDPE